MSIITFSHFNFKIYYDRNTVFFFIFVRCIGSKPQVTLFCYRRDFFLNCLHSQLQVGNYPSQSAMSSCFNGKVNINVMEGRFNQLITKFKDGKEKINGLVAKWLKIK